MFSFLSQFFGTLAGKFEGFESGAAVSLTEAAKHLGELVHARRHGEALDIGEGAPALDKLTDSPLLIAKSGQLGQVGDAKDLVAAAELPELLADH